MAEETKKATAPETAQEVVVCDVPVAEEPTKEAEAEAEAVVPAEPMKETEAEKESDESSKITESVSFKEESNKVDDLIDPEKKALDEFKLLIQEALNNHDFTAPPSPAAPAVKEEEDEKNKEEEEPKPEEKKEEEEKPKPAAETCEEAAVPAAKEEPSEATVDVVVVEKAEEKVEVAEEIKETIVQQVKAPTTTSDAVPAEEEKEEEAAAPPPPPEEVSIWGIPLLADERSDVILLKFLRARDFKVKEALTMLKNVVAWRKEFKIDQLLEEEIGEGLEKVVYVNGVDKEGHPISYNAFGEFQDKDLYSNTFSDAEKRANFLRFYIQFLEKNIRTLDFSPEGTCTIVQVTDLSNYPGLFLFKKELRQATNQALQLLQDNYPEFVAKQVCMPCLH